MKKIVSILLTVLILVTGCSFIGHKDLNDTGAIIPAAVQSSDSTGNAAADNEASSSASNTSQAQSSQSGIAQASNGEASGISSGIASGEISVDNGTGKGMTSVSNDKNSLLMTLYYRNKAGLLIPVTRTVSKQEGIAKAALNGLVNEAVTREQLDYYGLYPVLPEGTKIKGLSIKNQAAVIDFSKEFSNLETKQDEQLAVAAVVYTLTGFKTISDVSIRVDGKQLEKLYNGTDISKPMNRQNTFINSGDTVLKDDCIKCDIYYIADENDKFNYLVPVSLQIPKTDSSQIPQLIFDDMSKKPTNSNIFTSFPEGTKLLSFENQNNVAVLNFSSQIGNYGGTSKEDSLLKQIYYTIGQLKSIDKVKILIDGKETTLPEGTEVANAKNIPAALNNVIGS